jgi:hypothetical protein
MSDQKLGKLSNGAALLTGITMTGYKDYNHTNWVADKGTLDRTRHEVQGFLTPDALDPRTLNQNINVLGKTTYPGGENPRKYNGDYDYSHIPKYLSEYPAIGHDRRYDNLGITGKSGLFLDTRAIGADWQFVKEELQIASLPISTTERVRAALLGIGLGMAATPKTLYQYFKPFSSIENELWHNISNIGVTNSPSQ